VNQSARLHYFITDNQHDNTAQVTEVGLAINRGAKVFDFWGSCFRQVLPCISVAVNLPNLSCCNAYGQAHIVSKTEGKEKEGTSGPCKANAALSCCLRKLDNSAE